MEAKQVLVVRRDLKMRRGKEVSQGAHASMIWLLKRIVNREGKHFRPVDTADFSEAELEWMLGSFTKITLQVESEKELLDLQTKALEAGLQAHVVVDQGRTEFNGVPTATALAIGPDYADKIDSITGDLKLY